MPFEFTGKPPAFQATESPFTPFFFSAAPAPASIGGPTFGSAAGFGVTASPWASFARSASPSPSPTLTGAAFGAPFSSASDGKPKLQQGGAKHVTELVETEKAALSADPAGGALAEAIRRGVLARPALFGRANVAADGVLDGFLKARGVVEGECQVQIAGLSKEVRGLGGGSMVKGLMDYLFEEVARGKTLGIPVSPAPGSFASHQISPAIDDSGKQVGNQDAAQTSLTSVRPQKYFVAVRSPAYQALLAGLKDSPILRKVFVQDHELDKYSDELVCMLGGGANINQVEQRAHVLLSGRARSDRSDAIAVTEHLFQLAYEIVVEKQLATEKHGVLATEGEALIGGDVEPTLFRFMDLPPELRMLVYRELLAPGHISLRSNHNETHRGAREPSLAVLPRHLTPSILCTCKLAQKEAQDLLYAENTICITVAVAFGCRSMIHTEQVPSTALPQLKKVMLVFDNVHANDLIIDGYHHVDWRQLQAMTGLKEARICLIDRSDLRQRTDHKSGLLQHVLERLPADCNLAYGAREAGELEHMEEMKVQFLKGSRHTHYKLECYEVDGTELEEAARGLVMERGCKSGHTRDYRYPERNVGFGLKPLVQEEGLDESIVLGR